jgi:hypothetical protein
MSAFYVTDTEARKIGMLDIFGPYETRAAAEAFIRKDFADWWEESETPLKDRDESACGTISYLLCGGPAAKQWTHSKLKESFRGKD